MKKITDTSKVIPIPALALVSPPGFIERMEAEGQQELVGQTEQLPTEGLHRVISNENPTTVWESMGITIGDVVGDDPIWTQVALPAGWKIKPTDHSMWSDLVDDKRRKRAAIFYKAAFYDRSCFIRPVCRFSTSQVYPEGGHPVTEAVVADANFPEPIQSFHTEVVPGEDRWLSGDRVTKLANDWLTENYPDYENPAAYWD